MVVAYLETIMLIAFGFALASLIGLFVFRAIWNHGERTGRKRIQRQIPISNEELRSDRARLRAENAIHARKIELQIQEYRIHAAEKDRRIAEFGVRIDELKREIAANEEIINKFRGGRAPLEAELVERTSNLQQLHRTARDYLDQIQRLSREVEAARVTIREKDKVIADLRRARHSGHTTAQDVPANITNAQRQLQDRIRSLDSLTDEITQQREQFRRTTSVSGPADKTPDNSTSGAGDTPTKEEIASRDRFVRKLDETARTASRLKTELENLDGLWESKLSMATTAGTQDESTAGRERKPLELVVVEGGITETGSSTHSTVQATEDVTPGVHESGLSETHTFGRPESKSATTAGPVDDAHAPPEAEKPSVDMVSESLSRENVIQEFEAAEIEPTSEPAKVDNGKGTFQPSPRNDEAASIAKTSPRKARASRRAVSRRKVRTREADAEKPGKPSKTDNSPPAANDLDNNKPNGAAGHPEGDAANMAASDQTSEDSNQQRTSLAQRIRALQDEIIH